MAKRTFDLYEFVVDGDALTPQEKKYARQGLDVLDLCKLIATSVRSIPKVFHELSIKPDKGCDTRFLSKLQCARDVQKVLNELVELKREREFACRMGIVLSGAITKLNGLRNELSDCSETKPTIHLVWEEVLRLKYEVNKISKSQERPPFIRALAKSCLVVIKHKLNDGFISDVHKMATFLDPRMRHMSHMTAQQKEELYETIRQQIAEMPLTQRNYRTQSQPTSADIFANSDDEETELIVRRADAPLDADEVTAYVNDKFPETAATVFDILSFWHSQEERYPRLSKLAMRLLSVPASSASCERAFRRLKAIITDSRESLSVDTVVKLMLSKALA